MCVVALRYLVAVRSVPATAGSWAYALSATIGHMGLLAFGSILVVYLPCRWLRPLRRLARPLAILAAALAALTLLVMDTNLFARHGFHLGVLTAALFEWHTWALAAVMLLVFTALSAALATRAEAIARRPGARLAGPDRRRDDRGPRHRQSHRLCLGRRALRRPRYRLWALSAGLLPADRQALLRPPRPGRSGGGAGCQHPAPGGQRRRGSAQLSARAAILRAARGPAERPDDRHRRPPVRRDRPVGNAFSGAFRERCDRLRAALQRRQLDADGHVLAALRAARRLLRQRLFQPDAGTAHGPVRRRRL